MSPRHVYPELFFAAGAPIVADGRNLFALRWILHPSVGMPRAVFNVWKFEGGITHQRATIHEEPLDFGKLLSWNDGPAVSIVLTLTVPSGSVVLRAHTAPSGAGHVLDEKTVVGPGTSLAVRFVGSVINSITLTGNAIIESALIIKMDDFVNHTGWTLVERVGLPVSSPTFDGTGYPLGMQGPIGFEVDPVTAAVRRVLVGTPDAGWPPTTDRGTSPEPFVAPDPDRFVRKELNPLLDAIAKLFREVDEPSKQIEHEVEVPTTAPTSVHDVAASSVWQSRAHPSTIRPLETMLLAAGSDTFAALGLGFGTTFDMPLQTHGGVAQPPRTGPFMVTVEHTVTVETEIGPIVLTLKLSGELAAVCFVQPSDLPAAPTGLTALPPPNRDFDPPGAVDGRWLEIAEVSWALPVIPTAGSTRPSGFAVARGLPGSALSIRTEKRSSGGWMSFVPASSPEEGPQTSIRFTEAGLPEAFPGDPATFVYSVATEDWFGRWSGWVSTDHPRASVAPQIPRMRKIELQIEESQLTTRNASAAIEFTWDWSHRRPLRIQLRVLLHTEGTAAPTVDGSVLSVGGPTVTDLVIDFTSASIDSPPAGVEEITEESTGNLRTYRVLVGGIALTFGTHQLIRATARARATERVVPTRQSAWSQDITTSAASPIPPPPPFVPAEMWWASLVDPRGVARTTLKWEATAPQYAVYLADESALRRELEQPSADLEVPAADRLPALRALDIGGARRAFRRIADRVSFNELQVELPRGSKLIHFYGVIPISNTGVEGTLPDSGNSYFAVAVPEVKSPEQPVLIARDGTGAVAISIRVEETRVPAQRVEIYRAPSRDRAVAIEYFGPPIAVIDESVGLRTGRTIQWQLNDPLPGPAWQPLFYRAVAFGPTDRTRGVYGGRSRPSPTVEIVPGSTSPPQITDLQVEDILTEMDHRLVSFMSDVPLARTYRGVHVFTIRTIALDGSISKRSVSTDTLPLISGTFPGLAEQPDSIFRYDATNPRAGRTYAWIPRDVRAVILEVTDPAGRVSSRTWVP